MAELVDALVSGTSVRKYVQVRVLFWAHDQSESEGESEGESESEIEIAPIRVLCNQVK